MSSSETRDRIVEALGIQFRYVSANSVLFGQAVADRVGIHPTDNECLDFLILKGSATAGELSALTGLTTGAITAVIDRLERAGYVKRQQDPKDRRKVLVVPDTEKAYREIGPHAMQMYRAMETANKDFTDEELAVVLRYLTKANASATEAITRVREVKA